MKIEEIAEKLKDRKIAVVAEKVGATDATIRSIANGKNTNPTYAIYMALVKYFREDQDNG